MGQTQRKSAAAVIAVGLALITTQGASSELGSPTAVFPGQHAGATEEIRIKTQPQTPKELVQKIYNVLASGEIQERGFFTEPSLLKNLGGTRISWRHKDATTISGYVAGHQAMIPDKKIGSTALPGLSVFFHRTENRPTAIESRISVQFLSPSGVSYSDTVSICGDKGTPKPVGRLHGPSAPATAREGNTRVEFQIRTASPPATAVVEFGHDGTLSLLEVSSGGK